VNADVSTPLPGITIDTLPPLQVAGRLDRLRASFDGAGVDALVVTAPSNVRYLTGFTGSAATLWVDARRAVLVTDGRYRDQAPDQMAAAGVEADVVVVGTDRPSPLANLSSGLSGNGSAVGLEAGSVTWAEQRRLADVLVGDELVASEGLVEALREVKDDGEVARIAVAAAVADRALAQVEPDFVAGVAESDLAVSLDHSMRAGGATDRAFETIVAGGPNSARPHARPGTRLLEEGDLVVRDFGAVVDGYRSDMTRTMRVGGTGTGREAEMLAAVLEAQTAGLAVVADGVPLFEVDAACRTVLAEAGLAEAFTHGTGHGVGLDIHEGPGVSSSATGYLRAGQVVTVEPGAYVSGLGGVRWEDTVLVTGDGHRQLTCSPKTL